jgi:hypothetical protein
MHIAYETSSVKLVILQKFEDVLCILKLDLSDNDVTLVHLIRIDL